MQAIGAMIAQGRTAEVYAYGDGRVLKLYRENMNEQMCRDEFARARIVHKSVPTAPEPIELVREQGRIGIVYERIDGDTMLKKMLSALWKVGFYAKSLAELHIGLRRPIEGDLPTVKEKLRGDIRDADLLTRDEREILYRALDALPDGNTLCHFDFHPDNVMLAGAGPRVIDWMTACKGDPLADVARTGIMLKFAEIPGVPAIVSGIAHVLNGKFYKKYASCYLRATGEDARDVEKWESVVIGARLCEGVSMEEKQRLLAHLRRKLEGLS